MLAVTEASTAAISATPAVNNRTVESTIATLVEGWNGEALRIPRYAGKRGHPVLAARRLFEEFLAAEHTPKDVITRHESGIVYVDVNDPGVVEDADTPHDYQKLIANG